MRTRREVTERRVGKAMSGIGYGRVVRGARGRRGALVLAVAVLLCHGLYGASHQVQQFGPEAPGQEVVPHSNQYNAAHGKHGGDDQGQGHTWHPDGMVAYAASLSGVLLAATFALALGGTRVTARAALAAAPGRRYAPSFLRPARGSPLPVLQVFRL